MWEGSDVHLRREKSRFSTSKASATDKSPHRGQALIMKRVKETEKLEKKHHKKFGGSGKTCLSKKGGGLSCWEGHQMVGVAKLSDAGKEPHVTTAHP